VFKRQKCHPLLLCLNGNNADITHIADDSLLLLHDRAFIALSLLHSAFCTLRLDWISPAQYLTGTKLTLCLERSDTILDASGVDFSSVQLG